MLRQLLGLVVIFASKPSCTTYTSNDANDIPVDFNDLGPYSNMVGATQEILPVIADVLEKISRDEKLAKDPLSPEGLLEVMLAFMPISKRVLLAAATVEGKKVTQGDLDRLEKIQRDLPEAFSYISSLRKFDFHTSASSGIPSPPPPPPAPYARDDVFIGTRVFESKVTPATEASPSRPFPSITSSPFRRTSSSPSPATKSIRVTGTQPPRAGSLNQARRSQRLRSPLPIPSASGAPSAQNAKLPFGPSSFGSRHPSAGQASALYGTRAIAEGSHLSSPPGHPAFLSSAAQAHFSLPQHPPLPSSPRVLRGASISEEGNIFEVGSILEKRIDFSGDGSKSFVQLPFSSALFIRHPSSKDQVKQ